MYAAFAAFNLSRLFFADEIIIDKVFTYNTLFVGIAFLITNYLKGVFFALFSNRSGAVRSVQHPSRSQKIIKKYALLGASHFCG